MRKWLVGIVALLLVLGAGGWLFASPGLTLSALRRAADARDANALSAHIDFAALRESVKRQLADRTRGERGVLGVLVSAGIADPLVDAALTPEGMRVVFATAPVTAQAEPGGLGVKAQQLAYRRESWDRFSLARPDGTGPVLVFRLQGLDWMLVDVRLPAGGLD